MSQQHLPAAIAAASADAIEDFCRRWRIVELAVFGSVLRDDFRADSDIDVLVTFAPEARITLFDLAKMAAQLQDVFGREVDVVEKAAVRNPFIRHRILRSHRVLYAA